MGFEEDLDIGKRLELQVLKMIQQKYPKAFQISGYCKEYDIFVPELQIGVEVKSDQKSQHTGNIVIEFEFNGKPSALATTKAAYWVIYDGSVYVWFTPENIKKCIIQHKLDYYTFKGKGDEHFKKAYLINKQLLYQYALMINN